MSAPEPLAHIDKYGEANLDAGTLRILRDNALRANGEDTRIRGTIKTRAGRKEWDDVFKQDTIDRTAAIERIDAELNKRGISR